MFSNFNISYIDISICGNATAIGCNTNIDNNIQKKVTEEMISKQYSIQDEVETQIRHCA